MPAKNIGLCALRLSNNYILLSEMSTSRVLCQYHVATSEATLLSSIESKKTWITLKYSTHISIVVREPLTNNHSLSFSYYSGVFWISEIREHYLKILFFFSLSLCYRVLQVVKLFTIQHVLQVFGIWLHIGLW